MTRRETRMTRTTDRDGTRTRDAKQRAQTRRAHRNAARKATR